MITLHKVIQIREFWTQLWVKLCYLTKDFPRLIKNTQTHNFSSIPTKKKPQTKTQNILEILSSHTQTPINAGNPSGALVLFLKWLYTLGMSLGSFCAIRKRKESFTYLVKLAFFHVLWKLGACTAKRVTRVLTRGAKIVQFKSRSDFLKQAKALPSEIQCQEWRGWGWDSSTASQGEFLFYGG